MSVTPFGAPARAAGTVRDVRTNVAIAATTIVTAAALLAPLPAAAASPPQAGGPHDRAMTVVEVYEDDTDADGAIDFLTTATSVYGSDGLLLTNEWATDVGADGTTDSMHRESLTYVDGRITRSVAESFYDPDPFADARTTTEWTYDAKGRLVLMTQAFDQDADGVADGSISTVETWTKKPSSTTSTIHEDYDGDGISEGSSVYYSEVDNRGRMVLSRWAYDMGDDGDIDSGVETTTAYSNKGAILAEHTVELSPDSSYTSDTTWTYDRHGLMTGSVTVDGDGITTRTVEYGDDEQVLRATETVDEGGNGIVDSTLSTAFVWADGLLVSMVEEYRLALAEPDPRIAIYTTTWAYDEEGRTILRTYDIDEGADGVESREKTVSVYDAAGRVLSETTTSEDGAGSLTGLTRETNVYDAQGSLVWSMWEVDNEGDGVIDYRSTKTITVS